MARQLVTSLSADLLAPDATPPWERGTWRPDINAAFAKIGCAALAPVVGLLCKAEGPWTERVHAA
eukprot:CAMPEP_0178444918 /NCGR_PEP_ID=MMETSP0689_2-20121128/39834_1 /TAXON_ID=160604 /ORGANISM="Amphidinium massartii, Strain CS-259" /LENGTH=64 /DNA_ID=CAMNT_0020069323 /DNA_START=105 /DNA_END=295 /DNA_ORIENTATION=+